MNQKSRILIVDDDPAVLVMLHKTLSADGFEITTATTGDDAVRLARLDYYDLIMIDLVMPRKDGIETILELRSHDKLTPVIAMSGKLDDGFHDYLPLAENIGDCLTLTKPFSQAALLSIIGRALDTHRRQLALLREAT